MGMEVVFNRGQCQNGVLYYFFAFSKGEGVGARGVGDSGLGGGGGKKGEGRGKRGKKKKGSWRRNILIETPRRREGGSKNNLKKEKSANRPQRQRESSYRTQLYRSLRKAGLSINPA